MDVFRSFETNICVLIVRASLVQASKNNARKIFQMVFAILKLILPHISLLVFGILFAILYLIFDAKTFRDYSGGVHSLVAVIKNYSYVLIVNERQREKIFRFIDKIRSVIGNRIRPESRIIYVKAKTFVNKLTKIIYFIFLKIIIPLITLPYAFASYYLYFSTDLGRDAFQLPFHGW